ncbi:O-antigen/teichoic acid export membrane protein [Bradyrhizobium sp. USDA 4369]
MSERPILPPELPPPQRRSGCLTALAVIAGLVLLFPAACVLVVFPNEITRNDLVDPIGLLFICAAIAGIVLIVLAIRRGRGQRDDP